MFPMYVSIFCCQYFENYYILSGQLGHLGGAIFMPFMINFWWSCPTNLKNEFSKNVFFTWFSSPKIAPKKIPTENYRKFSLISMLLLWFLTLEFTWFQFWAFDQSRVRQICNAEIIRMLCKLWKIMQIMLVR